MPGKCLEIKKQADSSFDNQAAEPVERELRPPDKIHDDAFTAPLTALDRFEVDYLAKNLKVKLLKGKRYDFTDPDGNADRLFVFQRDVEKARERLKNGDPAAP